MTTAPIRVRFAPSPTGYLHVGGARTALFNWLLARHHGGTFVLRIEDTDMERSSAEMVDGILDGMRWLGLDWDEGPGVGGSYGPYFQSERLARYREMAEQLVATGHAYYDYRTPEEVAADREASETGSGDWQHHRVGRTVTAEQAAEYERQGRPRAIRVLVPEGRTTYADLVHGPIEFDHAHIEDFVVLRSDGYPTYHLSVVCDDIDMRITHVVRGDDHISNTPKQVLLYTAFGAALPKFAHVPLILGPDKKRLSKRHGATSVTEYERQGFLPEAMVNFLALLGWSPGNDRELLTRDELVEAFSIDGISGGNAVFNSEKLEWFNNQHTMRLSAEDLATRIEPGLREAGLWRDEFASSERPWLLRIVELLKPRAHRLLDFVPQAQPLLAERVEIDPAAAAKHLAPAGARAHVEAITGALGGVGEFTAPQLEQALRDLATARGVKAGTLIHATRVCVTGRTVSPGLFEVLELLGRDRVLARLTAALPLCG
jgi:glutamyl-tRNA synthetase